MNILEDKTLAQLTSLKPIGFDPKALREFAKIFLAHKEQGKDFLKTAIHCLEYASRLDPKDENVLIDLVHAYIENNQIDQAIEVAKLLLKINTISDKGHALLGSLYLSQGEKSKAKLSLEKALVLDNYKNINLGSAFL